MKKHFVVARDCKERYVICIGSRYPQIDGENISISIGLAKRRFGQTPTQVLEKADEALYKAKQHRDYIFFYKEND